MAIYGYARISTRKQNIDRQIRNILEKYPTAIIYKEAYSGRKISRPEFNKLAKRVQKGDTIVFDSVSRMSRNADEGVQLYEKWYNEGINLVFIKEPSINTDTYKNVLKNNVPMTGTNVDVILKGVNEYLMILAKEQVRLAFEQSQKEVDDLRQRTKEGLVTAKNNGKQVGAYYGRKLTTKKSIESKKLIRKYSKVFDGMLNDTECIKQIGIDRNTFYKYKKEMLAEEADKETKLVQG